MDGFENMDAIGKVMADPNTSEWLKTALRAQCGRDGATALNDAHELAELLEDKLREDQAWEKAEEARLQAEHDRRGGFRNLKESFF